MVKVTDEVVSGSASSVCRIAFGSLLSFRLTGEWHRGLYFDRIKKGFSRPTTAMACETIPERSPHGGESSRRTRAEVQGVNVLPIRTIASNAAFGPKVLFCKTINHEIVL